MSEGGFPIEWQLAKLSDAIAVDGVISDGDWVESKDQDPSGSVRLIQLADVGDGDFKNKSQRFMTPEAAERLNCTYLEKGDVLIARMPDPLGRACLFPGVGQDAVTVVDVCLIRTGENSAFANTFLKYWINTPDIRNLIEANASGTTRKRITRKKLEAFEYPLPPLAEQKEIAARLDDLLAQVDSIKTRLDGLPAILKRFRQSVLAAAVSGKLTEEWREENGIVAPWKVHSIKELAEDKKYSLGIGPFGSNLKVSDYRSEGHPLVFVREIRAQQFGGEKTKYVDSVKFNELKPHRVEPGNILVTKMGDPPGDVAIYPKDRPEAVITSDCIKLSVNNALASTEYVYLSMRSESFRAKVFGIAAGVAQQKVNLKKFRMLEIELPRKEEQTEIVRRVEAHVQSAFVVLMLTEGFIPCLPPWPIKKIRFQGKRKGIETDDFIAFVEGSAAGEVGKLLVQIKHSIAITEKDSTFADVIKAAWDDFNNKNVFDAETDGIALVSGPLSAIDVENVSMLLEWARHSEDSADFVEQVELAHYSSDKKREKLKAFREQLTKANDLNPVTDDELWRFMKCFHLLGYDLDIKSGVALSLVKSIIGRNAQEDASSVWLKIVNEAQSFNKNAGAISLDDLPWELRDLFKERPVQTMPTISPPAVQPFDWDIRFIRSGFIPKRLSIIG